VLVNQRLRQYQLNRDGSGVIPFLGITRPARRNNIVWCVFAAFAHRYNVVLREALKLLATISTSIFICCLDIIPLLKRQSADDQPQKGSPFGVLSVLQERHSFFVGLFPFLSYISFTCRVTLIPISVHRQFMFSVGSVAFTMFCQDVFAIIGIMFIRAFAKLFSIPVTVSLGVINKALVAGVAIPSRGVSFLLRTSSAYYDCHYSIISQKG